MSVSSLTGVTPFFLSAFMDSPSSTRTRSQGNTSPSGAALRRLQALGAASVGKAVQSALQKMERVGRVLAQAADLDSAVVGILAEQSKQTDQRCELARSVLMAKFDQLRRQHLLEQQQIQKRIVAERSSSFWSKLIHLFKGLATALSVVSSVFTGPIGVAAASLTLASLVVSTTVPADCGQWLSLGLSVAGALCGGASCWLGEAEKGATGLVTAVRVGGGVGEGVAASGTIVRGYQEKMSLQAQAGLFELKAASRQILAEAEKEREELKLLLGVQDRAVRAVNKLLQTRQGIAMRTLQEREA